MRTTIIGLSALAIITLSFAIGVYISVIQQVSDSIEPVAKATSAPVVIQLPLAENVEANLNQYRISQGLPALNSEVASLDQAAQARAESMCADNNWSHARDWEVLDQYYLYSHAGENLYYGSLQTNQAAIAVTSWTKSPTHLANIVGSYSEIGVGVKSCPSFQGNKTAVIITNYFGVPR
jgi:uncharacterized protein YkwD